MLVNINNLFICFGNSNPCLRRFSLSGLPQVFFLVDMLLCKTSCFCNYLSIFCNVCSYSSILGNIWSPGPLSRCYSTLAKFAGNAPHQVPRFLGAILILQEWELYQCNRNLGLVYPSLVNKAPPWQSAIPWIDKPPLINEHTLAGEGLLIQGRIYKCTYCMRI